MGLDTTHNCWHGPYSAFNWWRDEVARIADVQFTDEVFDAMPDGALYGRWPETPDEPLWVLLAHSDCEGAIYPAQALPLAARLQELVPALEQAEAEASHRGLVARTLRFINGLRKAAAAGEAVEFH